MLEIKDLSAGYGKKTVLRSVCVGFEKGKITAVIGINGSGKSTLLKTIVGIAPHFCGEITVNGEDLCALKRSERAKKIAFLAQGARTPDRSVGELVLSGRFSHLSYPRIYTERDREIAKEAMVRMGIDSLSDMPLSSLSGGMRQSAYIAMALAQETDYILLDEPTTYLDISHQLELMKILRELASGGKGIITVMHDLPMALNCCDKIILLADGEVLGIGTPEEIYESGAVQCAFGVDIKKDSDGGYFYSYK